MGYNIPLSPVRVTIFVVEKQEVLYIVEGRDSSVGIVTGHGLDGPGMESRWGARFSAPVQTGPGAHPASCTMGTGSFPGVKLCRMRLCRILQSMQHTQGDTKERELLKCVVAVKECIRGVGRHLQDVIFKH